MYRVWTKTAPPLTREDAHSNAEWYTAIHITLKLPKFSSLALVIFIFLVDVAHLWANQIPYLRTSPKLLCTVSLKHLMVTTSSLILFGNVIVTSASSCFVSSYFGLPVCRFEPWIDIQRNVAFWRMWRWNTVYHTWQLSIRLVREYPDWAANTESLCYSEWQALFIAMWRDWAWNLSWMRLINLTQLQYDWIFISFNDIQSPHCLAPRLVHFHIILSLSNYPSRWLILLLSRWCRTSAEVSKSNCTEPTAISCADLTHSGVVFMKCANLSPISLWFLRL